MLLLFLVGNGLAWGKLGRNWFSIGFLHCHRADSIARPPEVKPGKSGPHGAVPGLNRPCRHTGVLDTEQKPGTSMRKVEVALNEDGCIVVTSRGAGDELRRSLLARLPAWQVPRKWWFVDSLSANSRGKLSHGEWRDRFKKEELCLPPLQKTNRKRRMRGDAGTRI